MVAPPSNLKIVDDWLSLVKIKFSEDPGCCIAVPIVLQALAGKRVS